ncbi:MAG: PAS domain S-box protein [Nitrospirales bacterium]|nr:MAG: PAS domain S-box protein [Nitrospirales bacterium]
MGGMKDMSDTLRILHLEDNPDDVELVRKTIAAQGIEAGIVDVENRADFINALVKGGYDLVLADYTLPSFDGLSALAIARAKFPFLPFIFVSGTMGEEKAVETLKHGATDYVLKTHLTRLVPSIMRALREAEECAGRKKAQEALLDSEKRYRTIVENITDALYMHDFKGNIIDVNENACRLLRYKREELIGTNLSMIDSEVNKRLLPERMNQLLKDNSILFDGQHVRKDGSMLPVEISVKVVTREGSGIIQGFVRDISDRKKTEEEIRQRIQELEDFYDMAIGRELRMIELKEEIEKLKEELAKCQKGQG